VEPLGLDRVGHLGAGTFEELEDDVPVPYLSDQPGEPLESTGEGLDGLATLDGEETSPHVETDPQPAHGTMQLVDAFGGGVRVPYDPLDRRVDGAEQVLQLGR